MCPSLITCELKCYLIGLLLPLRISSSAFSDFGRHCYQLAWVLLFLMEMVFKSQIIFIFRDLFKKKKIIPHSSQLNIYGGCRTRCLFHGLWREFLPLSFVWELIQEAYWHRMGDYDKENERIFPPGENYEEKKGENSKEDNSKRSTPPSKPSVIHFPGEKWFCL